jgi:hypothetical protein
MINLLHLSKLRYFIFLAFLFSFNFNSGFAAVDIWEKKEKENEQKPKVDKKIIKSPTIVENENNTAIEISEDEISNEENTLVGIFDPEENNFNLNMWSKTDGEEIKKTLERINKINLSKISEDLLFKALFTNAYAPENNLSTEEFLKTKIDWLIKNKRIKDLEILLQNNPEVGTSSKAIKFLLDEYLSKADLKSACDKVDLISRKVQDTYLAKFKIYCLIYNKRNDEAQLIYDLLKENGKKDKFFDDKINFLLNITEKTSQKILDNNLLNFYLSQITVENFSYIPNEKTDKYIWKYLSAANLIEVNSIEDEKLLLSYEVAAAKNSFEKDEIFKIYLNLYFNFNQLVNAKEIYVSLPNYKARALIYQSILLTDDVEKKISLAYLLKQLFEKDKLSNIFSLELSNILKSINPDDIPESYADFVKDNTDKELLTQVKFNNDILHRSKILKHFLIKNYSLNKTEKDFKTVYKKIKKNKKYFISIMDIIVLESLVADGIILPTDLDYKKLSSDLTIPKNLQDLASQNQIGLVMLKIVEIIGEDEVKDLDPETLYFLNKILNDLNLKKIRNIILNEAMPVRV